MPGSQRMRSRRNGTIATSTASPCIGPDARIAIILNGNAKQVTRRYADNLKAIAGPHCDVFMTTSMSHADFVVQSVVDDAYDLVITGGGDGTVLHTIDTVLNRIEGRAYAHCPRFGVLRLGTGNAIAYYLGSENPKDNLLELDHAKLKFGVVELEQVVFWILRT